MGDFLDSVLGEEPPAAETEPTAEIQMEPVVEPVAQPEPAPVAPPVEQVQPERSIPLATALNWRDEAREYKQRLAEMEQQRQPSNRPDPFDDPEGYEAYLGNTLETRLTEQRFQNSALIADQAYGHETVRTATEWAAERAASDPGFRASWQQVLSTAPHPMEWVVQQHKQDSLVRDIGADPDEFVRRRAAELGLIAPVAAAPVIPVVAAPPAPRPAAPPRSIASEAPASAPATANDAKAEFDAIFQR